MSNGMEVSWCSNHHNVETLEIQGPCWERGKACSLCREAGLVVALSQWLHDFGSTNELSQRTRIMLGIPHPSTLVPQPAADTIAKPQSSLSSKLDLARRLRIEYSVVTHIDGCLEMEGRNPKCPRCVMYEAADVLSRVTPETPAPHTDDVAVDRFSAAMKAKLALKRAEGRGGWDDPDECEIEHLQHLLQEHVAKGDMVDIGNFAMMLFSRFKAWDDSARPAVKTISPHPEGDANA